jgi:hypothetical protein
LGARKDFDVAATDETIISAAARNAEYGIFASQVEDVTRVYFSFLLDPQILCINEKDFSRIFAPVQYVRHAHSWSGHLEKEIDGKHRRFVIAYFDSNGCASSIKFSQSN